MNSVNHQIRLAARPSSLPETSDWEITTEPVPAPGPGEFVVAISYLSIDPVMRRLIDAAYREPVAIGTVMEVGAVGRGTASELRGDRLLAATGQCLRVEGIGLETVGVQTGPHGIPVDEHLRAAERLWAIGDVNGIWPLTHVGEYEGNVVTANITGHPRPANYEAVPRVTYTDPQAPAVGTLDAAYSGTALVLKVSKTATYTHAFAQSSGFLTLLSDGEQPTGAYTPGAEPASGCSRRRWPSAPAS